MKVMAISSGAVSQPPSCTSSNADAIDRLSPAPAFRKTSGLSWPARRLVIIVPTLAPTIVTVANQPICQTGRPSWSWTMYGEVARYG